MENKKSRVVAGVLAIFLGCLGIHYFYCGKSVAGVVCLVIGLFTWGIVGILTLVQGIIILTKSDEEFEKTWVKSETKFPIF